MDIIPNSDVTKEAGIQNPEQGCNKGYFARHWFSEVAMRIFSSALSPELFAAVRTLLSTASRNRDWNLACEDMLLQLDVLIEEGSKAWTDAPLYEERILLANWVMELEDAYSTLLHASVAYSIQ